MATMKPFETIAEILFRRGLVASLEEAETMVRNGKVQVRKRDESFRLRLLVEKNPQEEYRFNEMIKLTGDNISAKSKPRRRISRSELGRRKASAARLVTFDPSKKRADRAAAKSGSAIPSCEDENDSRSVTADSTVITQELLERWIFRLREFAEMDQWIAVALSKGATVQHGVHTAELVPARAEDGHVHLKLVIR
jgi:hypothetical protein